MPAPEILKPSIESIHLKYLRLDLFKKGSQKKFDSMYKKIAAGHVTEAPLIAANLRHKNIGTEDKPHYLSLASTSKEESIHKEMNTKLKGNNNIDTFSRKMLHIITYSNMKKERRSTMGIQWKGWVTTEFPLVASLAQFYGPGSFPPGHPLYKFRVAVVSEDEEVRRDLASQFGCEGNGATSLSCVRDAAERFAIDIRDGGCVGSTAAAVQHAANTRGQRFTSVEGRGLSQMIVSTLHKHGHTGKQVESMHIHILLLIHIHTYTRTHTHIHIIILIRIHVHTHIHMHIHIHIHLLILTHMHTRTHTYAYSPTQTSPSLAASTTPVAVSAPDPDSHCRFSPYQSANCFRIYSYNRFNSCKIKHLKEPSSSRC
jgi:hypothetical protein